MKPSAPIRMNVVFQPTYAYRKATSGGAMIEPTEAPAPKMPWPSARSRTGNHSAIALVAPGQLPASPTPSKARNRANDRALRATKCRPIDTDHTTIDSRKPMRVPSASKILPNSDWPIA